MKQIGNISPLLAINVFWIQINGQDGQSQYEASCNYLILCHSSCLILTRSCLYLRSHLLIWCFQSLLSLLFFVLRLLILLLLLLLFVFVLPIVFVISILGIHLLRVCLLQVLVHRCINQLIFESSCVICPTLCTLTASYMKWYLRLCQTIVTLN